MDWALRSGLYCAKGIVEKGNATPALTFTLDVNDVAVEATFDDECAKLPLNDVLNDEGEPDPVIEPALKSLFSQQLGPDRANLLMDQLRDWIDPDSAGAFESNAPNRPFLHLQEFLNLPALTSNPLPPEAATLLPGLITVWSDGKVNVNTAPEPVLRAILPHLSDDTIAEVLEHRDLIPFSQSSDLEAVIGTLPGALPQKISFTSNVFTVNLTARSNSAVKRAEGVISMIGDEEPLARITMWRTWWPET